MSRTNVSTVASSVTCFPAYSRASIDIVDRPKHLPEFSAEEALAPFKSIRWLELTPAERLRQSWALRQRLPDLKAVHDCKLFPQP